MSRPLYLVDAFTEQPFAGNPAAVCLLTEWLDNGWLQRVAREMNQAETAYLVPEGTGYRLRWFTPTVEVDLCGHATLASAKVLWSTGRVSPDATIAFETRSGTLLAKQTPAGIELDFPIKPETPAEPPPALLSALGVTATYVGRNQFDYLVEVETAATVRHMTPNFAALAALPVRGVIVTSRSDDSQFDFISRFFAPGSGINEDPATGSAHCCLVDFWQKRLGKTDFIAYQASARGAVIRVRNENGRAILGGQAVIVTQGELLW